MEVIHSASLTLLLPGYYTTIQICICQAYLDRENAATGFFPSILARLNPLAKRSTSSSAISSLSSPDMAMGETAVSGCWAASARVCQG